MAKPIKDRESVTSADAMNTVLQAEQRALEAIKDCERQAADIIDAAQQQARAIGERTNRRIVNVHAHCARVTGERIETMLKEDSGKVAQTIRLEEDASALATAVDRVAARVTGEQQHDAPSTERPEP